MDIDEAVKAGHAEKYQNGCYVAGHRCEDCTTRLGETPHAIRSRKVGARPGYRGTWEHECTVKGCAYS